MTKCLCSVTKHIFLKLMTMHEIKFSEALVETYLLKLCSKVHTEILPSDITLQAKFTLQMNVI